MTYEFKKKEDLPKIGEPMRELKNGRYQVVGRVLSIKKTKDGYEVAVR